MRAGRRRSLGSLTIAVAAASIWSTGCTREPIPADRDGDGSPGTPVAAAPAAPVPPVPAAAREEADNAHSSKPPSVVIAAGTRIRIRTTNTVSTKSAQSGDSAEGHLVSPLVVEGRTVAPRGAKVSMRVVESDDGGRVKGRARLALRVTGINGLDARTGVYAVQARATKKKDAARIGVGSGLGAAIGAIAGGGKGAAIGAAAGGGAGTGVVLATRGEPAIIPAESILTFKLTDPIRVD